MSKENVNSFMEEAMDDNKGFESIVRCCC
jgi:hypothetical protein